MTTFNIVWEYIDAYLLIEESRNTNIENKISHDNYTTKKVSISNKLFSGHNWE